MNSVPVNLMTNTTINTPVVVEALCGNYVCVEELPNGYDKLVYWDELSEAKREEIGLCVAEIHKASGRLQELITKI
jgi:hypothetical protein